MVGILLFMALPGPLPAQVQRAVERPVATAAVTDRSPTVDGRLDEPEWARAAPSTEFRQTRPDPGADPSQRTEVRVLVGADALFVGFRAFDVRPDSVVGQITRRDAPSFSDRVHVVLDSFRDRRTAFHFAVNPRGVRWDRYRFGDTSEDPGWDPVWDVAARVDSLGWSAEFRIPLSQLRFSGGEGQRWGVDFYREIARTNEVVHWAPVPADSSAFVSRFGDLDGLGALEGPAGIEILPYTLIGAAGGAVPDRGGQLAVGADAKIGLPGGLTLDLTVNPDFGQVEADPGEVNLSALETFFPEKRPFFLEGAGLFRYSLMPWDGAPEQLFYSRRIGRAPSRGAPEGARDAPIATTLLGAAKVSGRTTGGWGLGLLAAVTDREEAGIDGPEGPAAFLMEPRAGYGVLRVRREADQGRASVGLLTTSVVRERAGADRLELPRSALVAGLDAEVRFGGDRHRARAFVAGSRVAGSSETVARLQASPGHGYTRPDAHHLRYDPEREALSGWSAMGRIERFSGGPWRWEAALLHRSAGFDANDAGFTPLAGFQQFNTGVRYERTEPGTFHRGWSLSGWAWGRRDLGGEWHWRGVSADGRITLPNFWSLTANVAQSDRAGGSTHLRGGPFFRQVPHLWRGLTLATDDRAPLQFTLDANTFSRSTAGTEEWSVSPSLRWRPSGRASLTLGARRSRNVDGNAWVGRVGEGEAARYVLARLDQTTTSVDLRAALAFTPGLTLEAYAQPFVSSGRYDGFLEVADAVAARYSDRVRPLVDARVDDDVVRIDGDTDGPTLPRPDFDRRQLRTNLVLRWEYRPGSTLFVVWAHGRDASELGPERGLSPSLDALWAAPAQDRLLLKATWWFGR